MIIARDTDVTISTQDLENHSFVFQHAQVDLHETEVRGGAEHSTAYVVITVPLRDDAARSEAYRLRDHVRGGRGTTPHPAEESTG